MDKPAVRTDAPMRPAAGNDGLGLGWAAGKAIRKFIQAGPKFWLGSGAASLAVMVFIISLGGIGSRGQADLKKAEKAQVSEERKIEATKKQTGAPVVEATAQDSKPPVDPEYLKEQIVNDAKKTARENYISGMRETARNNGLEISVFDEGSEIDFNSDAFKSKPDRDETMRQVFGPRVRKDLCWMGFKTVALKNGVFFQEGDIYSLHCPQTKEEKDAWLQEQFAKRQAFVDALQSPDVQVTQANNELIFTDANFADVSPQFARTLFLSKFTDHAKKTYCDSGFRGIRMRAAPKGPSTFLSFGCAK